ncbi:MAG: hypothetical protein EOP47_21305 [Sphingobacteriaceae bacterium]|nr:MAG: hypothetical protein EOP47_21305 [Sphingobacteriaceae bacterium]
MINPVQLSLTQPDGTARKIIIEPVLEKTGGDKLHDTGTYKIYKDAFDDKTTLFTEPREPADDSNIIPDEMNPDYLGTLTLNETVEYKGDLLSEDEQNQLRKYIQTSQP